MSTARRIQVGILAVVAVAFVGCGAAILALVRADLVGRTDDRLRAGAQTLEQLGGDVDAQIATLAKVGDQPDRESALLVFGPEGDLEFSVRSGRGAASDPLPDIGRIGVAGLRDRTGEPFGVDAVTGSLDYRAVSAQVGDHVVVIATPLSDVRDTLERLFFALVLSAGLAVVAIGVGTTIVIRRAISPIDDMIGIAAAIGAGDLAQRIDTGSHDPEVRRLSDALNDMLHQIGDAFALKDASEDQLRRFVADASHELRTPLTSMRGYAELYLGGAATDREDVDKAMTRIRSEAIRTGELVDALLLLARLDQGDRRVHDGVDLVHLARDAVADARAVEPDRVIRLDAPDHPVVVDGNEDELRQVLANLLTNTRAHAPGAAVHVVVSATDDEAEVRVRDDGPGLDPEQAGRVFDRFWRADESRTRKTGGSGLGLSILHAIVESHGGTVDLDTQPGQGATFTVRLPRSSR